MKFWLKTEKLFNLENKADLAQFKSLNRLGQQA